MGCNGTERCVTRLLDRVLGTLADPGAMRRVHGWATVFWIAMAPPSMLLWKDSIPYLVGLSVYAVVTGHWASWQACRTEELQQRVEDRHDDPEGERSKDS
jgi:hypothetical protein